jgi:hypothetical protein
MIHFKPTTTVVATAPVAKKQPVVLKRRYRVHPDGTTSPIEDTLDWDFDKMNNESAGF